MAQMTAKERLDPEWIVCAGWSSSSHFRIMDKANDPLVGIPGVYDTIEFDVAFRADLIVNGAVIVEAKAVSATLPVHRHQLLTYMRLSGIPTGLLLNFHANPFTKSIVRLSL